MAKPINLLILNQISQNGLKRLPAERYQIGKDLADRARASAPHALGPHP